MGVQRPLNEAHYLECIEDSLYGIPFAWLRGDDQSPIQWVTLMVGSCTEASADGSYGMAYFGFIRPVQSAVLAHVRSRQNVYLDSHAADMQRSC